MQKQAPTLGRLAVMVVFALSCFAIVMWLWASFGGPTPLAPKGYRFAADFDEATQLADNADVRISGVTVGHVIDSELHAGRTRATIEIESDHAPIPRNTKAILRSKTLLGETYIEITPGNPAAGNLRDGAVLPKTQVRPTVELDEITRALDRSTRHDLQLFIQGVAGSLERRGEDLNAVAGNLAPFAEDAGDVLRILDRQHDATRRLIRDTGVVFGALGRRQGQLSGLVRAADRVFATTAARNRELADTVAILPTTLRELRPTLGQLESLSREARPVLHDLRPAGRALAPTLRDTIVLAPELRQLFLGVDRVIDVSRTALPATTRIVNASRPLFQVLDLLLREAVPVVDYAGLYKQELVTSWADVAAANQAVQTQVASGPPLHYLRALVPFTSEGLVAYDQRLGTNRHNPYLAPRGLDKLKTGLESFDCQNTSNPGSGDAAPPCKVQTPLLFRGERNAFPHIKADR
jgi:phospholipid/cholesterol/gamma-HCH transport system substrate-binding protein